jgi:pimeloyl-ACP methyl ester carboxylesterase
MDACLDESRRRLAGRVAHFFSGLGFSIMSELRFQAVSTGSVELQVAQAGPATGPLVILLHGFPECWYGWHRQIDALAAAGYRVWAPDQRGYGRSSKPKAVQDYTLDKLAQDVAGLIEAAGASQAAVVGHDWGGAVAWWLASDRPELVQRLIILNVPHPAVLRRLILSNPRQTLRSWYMFVIQIPWLMDWAASRNRFEPLAEGMRTSSRPGTFTAADLEHYREAWSQPGAITAMLNWYRALFRYGVPRSRNRRVVSPTLVLWGKRDKFILPEAARASVDLCGSGKLHIYETATHWLQHEESEDVNRRVIDFLGETNSG